MSPDAVTTESKADRKAAASAAKQAEKRAKQQAKLDAAAAKQMEKESQFDAQHAPKVQAAADKVAAKEAKRAAKQAELDAKLARYKMLRANVRRRRVAYVFFIIFAIGVFAASAWDIVFNDSAYKLYVYGAYAVLFLFALLLLFSRSKHLEEVEELWNLERVFLEDPASGEVFQLSASALPALVGAEFSSPVTGEFYKMPALDSKQVERVMPSGTAQTRRFEHNGIKGEIATYGHEPKDVAFRTS